MIFGLGNVRAQFARAVSICLCIGSVTVLVGCEKQADQADVTTPTESADASLAQVSEDTILAAMESAQTYIGRGELRSAQAILEGLVEKVPRDVRPIELLGQVLYSRALASRNPETAAQFRSEAADAYRRAVEVDPDSAGLRHSAGLILLAADAQNEALEMFESAGRIDATNPQHPLFAAQLHISAKRYDEAEKALQRALQLDSALPHAHASLAVIAMERGEFELALQRITRAREIEPANVDFRAQEARVLRRSGKPREALQRLVMLPQHQRAEMAIASEIAAAYRAIDSPANAARAWQIAFGHQIQAPGAWYAAAQAADALIEAGEREQALIWIRQAEAIAPDEKLVRDVRARLTESGADETDSAGSS